MHWFEQKEPFQGNHKLDDDEIQKVEELDLCRQPAISFNLIIVTLIINNFSP